MEAYDFLVDVQRERSGRGSPRGALAMLCAQLLLPSVALAENLEGFSNPYRNDARALVDQLDVIDATREVASCRRSGRRRTGAGPNAQLLCCVSCRSTWVVMPE